MTRQPAHDDHAPAAISARGRLVAWIAVAVALAYACWLVARLALDKVYTIDEFQYAHAAWAIADGQVPYRDFFEVHQPLVYQLMSWVYVLGDSDPTHIRTMRALMLAFVALAAGAAWHLNRARDGRLGATLAPLLLLTLLPLTERLTEIRPDAAGGALFLAALAALRPRPGDVRRVGYPLLAGALAALSVWATQKAVFYNVALLAALVVDLLPASRRPDAPPPLLGDPRRFLLGATLVLVPALGWLLVHGALGDWLHWCFAWAAEHQADYPGFPWLRDLEPVLVAYWWLFALAAFGVVASLRARSPAAVARHDALLALALLTSFLSITLQRAPFSYSHIPFLLLVATFAARGACALFTATWRGQRAVLAVGLAFALALVLRQAANDTSARADDSNAGQRAVLAEIGRLTDPTDAAYDNSGGYVARPHAYFYFYTDALIRRAQAAELVAEVPRALAQHGAVLVVHDLRFNGLPGALQRHIAAHYQKYDGDLWLYGVRYDRAGRHAFDAVTDGRYFVHPPEAAQRVSLDGRPLTEPIVALDRGPHTVDLRAGGEAGPVYLLWLPRTGVPWVPQPDARPSYSRLL